MDAFVRRFFFLFFFFFLCPGEYRSVSGGGGRERCPQLSGGTSAVLQTIKHGRDAEI